MAEAKKTPDPASNPAAPQPGTVVTPAVSVPQPAKAAQAAAVPAPSAPAAVAPAPPAPSAAPQAPPQPVAQAATAPQAAPAATSYQIESPIPAYEPSTENAIDSDESEVYDDDRAEDQTIAWTASEFVAHHKTAGWYLLLAAGTLVLAALVFLIIRDKVSTGVIIVAGLLLGIYGAHQPRQLEYRINQNGIGIEGKYHSYSEFRSFSVVAEGAFASIVFMPLKRFGVPVTIYYAPEDEDKILSVLSDQLPFEEHHSDVVESLMRHIRF